MATILQAGHSYTLTGHQLNGLSQACYYGDDATMATNYPIVRLTNTATGAVRYCRTGNHSTMGVATGLSPVTTTVTVPSGTPTGSYRLEVIANGIPSLPYAVHVTVAKSPLKDAKDSKIEIKEHKVEFKELETKPILETKLKDSEGDLDQILQLGDPALQSALDALSARVDELSAAIQGQRTAITPEERPEVGEEALQHSKRKRSEDEGADQS
jgi:hypothetical protein